MKGIRGNHECGHDQMQQSSYVAGSGSIASTPPNLFNAQLREFMTLKIYSIFTRNRPLSIDTVTQQKLFDAAKKIEMTLMKYEKSEAEYSDLQTLESRVSLLVRRLNIYKGCGQSQTRPKPGPGGPHVFERGQSNITPYPCLLNSMTTTFRNSNHFSNAQSQLSVNNYMRMNRGCSINNVDSLGPSNLYGVTTSSGSKEDVQGTHSFKHIDPRLNMSNFSNPQVLQQTPLLKHQLPLRDFQSGCNFNETISQVSNRFKSYHLHNQYQHGDANDQLVGAQSATARNNQVNINLPVSSSHPLQHQFVEESSREIREHISVNLSPQTPVLPNCLSTRAPMSHQTASTKINDEEQNLTNANTITSKQVVNADCDPRFQNQIRWLLFLFHARYCVAVENTCASKYCFKGKELLKHIDSCKVALCGYQSCSQTRNLLRRFKQCRNQLCYVCVSVKNYIKKEKEAFLQKQPLKRAYPEGDSEVPIVDVDEQSSIKRLKLEQTSSQKSSKRAYNEKGAEVHSFNDEVQPSLKRLRLEQPPFQGNTSISEADMIIVPITKSQSSLNMLEKQGTGFMPMKKDGIEFMSVEKEGAEFVPVYIEVSDASKIPFTKDPEKQKHVAKDTRNGGESDENVEWMSEINAAKEEKVKQSVEVGDDSKNVISSLVELLTLEQVKEHINSLRRWVDQSKFKTEKKKAVGQSKSTSVCQLCNVEKLVFEPQPIYCSPCGARIKRSAFHYTDQATHSPHYVCSHCFNEKRDQPVFVNGTSIPKSSFTRKKNDEELGEPWVECDKCKKWQHQICALFNEKRNTAEAKYSCPYCYIKEVEEGDKTQLPPNAIPGVQALPVTALSNYIEQRLLKKLKEERHERAKSQGKTYDQVPGAESLSIRVVSSIDKVLPVKQRFFELFREENYPSEFPYKSKAILLFQKIEGVEVCLYALFVQEYGVECGAPNQRRVNISYLDSVKYFTPEIQTLSGESLRTFVYQEILIGYLDYCKKRGFMSCNIWACPPIKGEDYILYCHPQIQKIPKAEKLREWYLRMLKKASDEKVVVEVTNIYDHFFVQSGECKAKVTARRLPYFDGDYWPDAAEKLINDIIKADDGEMSKTNKFSSNVSKDKLLMQQLGKTVCPVKEDFIMIHLRHCCKHCSNFIVSANMWICKHCKEFHICDNCYEIEKNRVKKERHPINDKKKHQLYPVAINDVAAEITDKDDNFEIDFCEDRETFLNLCQRNNYQFDTLRRAKHSSMMILYHLHNPHDVFSLPKTCNNCKQILENAQGWCCEVCPDYELCNDCYEKGNNHQHDLVTLQKNLNKKKLLQKLRELLLHMVVCRYTKCQYKMCHTMKKLCRHCTDCKIGCPGGCKQCKKFWFMLKFHARFCTDSKCSVIKCRNLKSKQQELLEICKGDDATKGC